MFNRNVTNICFLLQIINFLVNYWWILYWVNLLLDNLTIFQLYNNFRWCSCHAIHTTHWEVECCTVILILSTNKDIRIFLQHNSYFQKGVYVIKSRISNYLMLSCQVFDKTVTNINFCYRLSIFCQLMWRDKSLST